MPKLTVLLLRVLLGVPFIFAEGQVAAATDSSFRVACQDIEQSAAELPSNTIRVLRMFDRELAKGSSPEVNVLVMPLHGQIARLGDTKLWQYYPRQGYVGEDEVTFAVEIHGRRYRAVLKLLLLNQVDEYRREKHCAKRFKVRSV